MLASKQTDGVVGVDVHWEMVPTPAGAQIPTPIPNPFVGIIFDPLGLAIGVGIDQGLAALTGAPPTGAVVVNFLPATNTGTEAMGFGHILIPPGTSWAPMPSVTPVVPPNKPPDGPDNPAMPDDDGIVVTGSKTVKVMGSNFARFGDMVMTCSEPVRMPSSTILAIPKGLPVLVGGPPTMDAMAALGAFIRTQWMSNQLHALLSRLVGPGRLRNLLSRAICFLTGHPVDVASGRVFTDHVDVDLPGPLPLKIERVYNSGFSGRAGSLGYGWSHSLEQKVWRERGKVVYLTEDGREVEFDTFDFPDHTIRPGEEVYYPIDRLTLKCKPENRWEVWTSGGICHDFEPIAGGDPGVARLVRMRTRDDHRIELHYDERACLSWVRDSGGRRVLFENDAAGRLTKIKLPVPRGEGHFEHLRYTYDERGDLVQITDALGNSWELEYTGHLLTRETDREKLSFYFGYDGIGQDAWCVRTWGDGGIYDHELVYDKVGRTTCVTNSLGHTTTYRMNEVGCVTEVIDPLGGVTKYEYDGRSLQRTAETDPLGHATRYSYDARGNTTRIEYPDGAAISVEVHPRFDAPLRAFDPNGNEWQWEYDEMGRCCGRGNPLGQWSRYEYQSGRLIKSIGPGGATQSFEYDAAGNVAGAQTRRGAELRFEHDQLGRPIVLVNAYGGVERRGYDRIGNLVSLEDPNGLQRHLHYDREQNLVRTTDSEREVFFSYTDYYRPHERREAGATVRAEYDTEGRLVALENEAGEVFAFEVDERGLVITETGFDGRSQFYRRDAKGQVIQARRASGRTEALQYDAAGRVSQIVHDDGEFERYRYGADGSLVWAANASSEVHLERDVLGRVIRERTVFDEGEYWVESGYGPDGSRVRVSTSDGHLHHVVRNEAGDVTRVELEARRWEVEFERDAHGLERARHFPGGVSSVWDRDLGGRPTRRKITFQGETTLDEKRYVWSGEQQLEALLDPARGDTLFERDHRRRLIAAKLPWSEHQIRALDKVGNPFLSADHSDRRYGPGGVLEEAEGVSYLHDADGNLVERTDVLGDVTAYRWNGAGMLESVLLPDGSEIQYAYDPFARRLRKRVYQPGAAQAPKAEVHWHWDGHTPLVELDSERGKSTWVFDPETFNPLAKLAEGSVWGVLTDHLGAPTELIAHDGSLAWRAQLDVLGDARTDVERTHCDFRFPGQQYDRDVALSYNRFRYYSPELGTYLSRDPLGTFGGLRLFGYAGDPTIMVDPLGLIIVIGETQDRVAAYARAVGGREIRSEWPRELIYPRPLTPAQRQASIEFNRQWVREAMDEGEVIHDLGRDPRRIIAGEAISDWYAAELEEIAAHPNAQRLRVRLRAEDALRQQAEEIGRRSGCP